MSRRYGTTDMKHHKLQHDKRNGNYFVKIMVSGVSKHFPFGTNKKQAEADLRQLETDIASGKIQFAQLETTQQVNANGKKDMRVEQLAVDHLKWVKGFKSAGTLRNRKHFVNQFLGYVGECMVSDITREKLEAYYLWAKTEKGRGENGGNEAMSQIRTFLRWGDEMGLIDLPCKFPKIVHTPPETKRLDDATLERLISNTTPDFADYLLFGVLAGLRPMEHRELMQTQRHYLPSGESFVKIEHHKTSKTARVHKPRSVPLSPEAEAIINRQIQQHPKSPFVFLNADGKPLTKSAIRLRLNRLCRRIGISCKGVCAYALRHTFASKESDNGADCFTLAAELGHKSIRTTQRYVTNSQSHHMDAVKAVAKSLQGVIQAGQKVREDAEKKEAEAKANDKK